MGDEPTMPDDRTPICGRQKRRPCRALALLWDLPMTRVASIRQVMFVFWARTRLHGKVRDFLPQHVKQATLLEAQLPNFMDLQTSWCKVFLGESGMAVSWPSRHATGALYGVVRLDRAPRPFSTSTWSLVPRQRCRSHDLGERAL